MSYEQSDRLDRHSSDRNSNAGVAGIAREAYDSSNGKWNWNLNTQDTASGALPSLTLSNGSSGEGSWMQNAAGQNSWAQGEGSWMPNAASAGENSAAALSGATGDAGTATAAIPQAVDGQSGNQANLPAELQQLETGIQQQLQQLAQEVAQLQAELGIPNQTTGDLPATPSQTVSNPGVPQTAVPPAESTPVASTSPQINVPTEATPVASTPPQSAAPTTDATIQALQTSNPQAAQLLTQMQPSQSGMSAAGYAQFENAFNQNIQGGQYADVASAANAAVGTLQAAGDTSDFNSATAVIKQDITPSNDAVVSTYNPANDKQVQNLASTGDSQLQQTLTSAWGDVQNGTLSPYGYSQFENTTVPLAGGNGGYQNDQQLEQAALTTLQPNLSSTDQSTIQALLPTATTTTDTTPTSSTPVATTTGDTVTGLAGTTGLTATINGFFNSAGQPVNLIGADADAEELEATTPAQVSQDFPGLNAIRLDVGDTGQETGLGGSSPGPEDPNIAAAIQAYTAAGDVVELELHEPGGQIAPSTTDPDGQTYLQEYQNWAQEYKNNPLVMLETPNEPSGTAADVASDEAQYIEAIRAQGFTNPIGVQPVSGYDETNIPLVLQDLQSAGVSTANLYVTPHIYYGGTDPNGALEWAQSEVAYAQQNGLPAFIDEYGNALDGQDINPEGQTVLTAMQTLDQQGYGTQSQVGSTFWGLYFNHPDGADSAFANPQGTQLTSSGQWLEDNTLA